MTDAPERIEVMRAFGGVPGLLGAPEFPKDEVVPYLRADLVPSWQPIETAPRDGTRILMTAEAEYTSGHCEVLVFAGAWEADHYSGALWMPDARDWRPDPTHWMPLPGPPDAD